MAASTTSLLSTLKKPSLIVAELTSHFDQDWGTSKGPQTVEGKEIGNDPFIEAYVKMSEILTNVELVRKTLGQLQKEMLDKVPTSNRVMFSGLSLWNSGKQIAALTEYFRNKHRAEKNPSLSKLLTNVLLHTERTFGFNDSVVTLSGGVDGDVFAKRLIEQGIRWKDVGVPGNHGEHTHRIQWYIVAKSLGRKSLVEIYEQVGKWFWKREGPPPKYLALWDALFDRAGGTTNPFEPDGDLDFRSPEKLCTWILKPENDSWFPMLRACLQARFDKRRDPDRFEIKDYLALKLYGKTISELQAEYKQTRDASRLENIAAHTDSPVDLGDGAIYKVAAKSKIHDRASFA